MIVNWCSLDISMLYNYRVMTCQAKKQIDVNMTSPDLLSLYALSYNVYKVRITYYEG